MNCRSILQAVPLALALMGCTSYQYAKNVKMVALDNNVDEGKSMGPIRGEDCQAFVMGYPIGEPPTLDKAVADTRKEHTDLRYLNNVSTDTTGFDAVVYKRRCIVVKGTAYK